MISNTKGGKQKNRTPWLSRNLLLFHLTLSCRGKGEEKNSAADLHSQRFCPHHDGGFPKSMKFGGAACVAWFQPLIPSPLLLAADPGREGCRCSRMKTPPSFFDAAVFRPTPGVTGGTPSGFGFIPTESRKSGEYGDPGVCGADSARRSRPAEIGICTLTLASPLPSDAPCDASPFQISFLRLPSNPAASKALLCC